ncbi:MAG: MCE family protein [Planctomycetes bacterium]|nr:MCE family protein [Planctomycetota bacterium]
MIGGTREIKVGLFIFIACMLLAVIIFSISDFYTGQPHYDLRVRFNFAGGVQEGAPVRLAGVDVGEVRSIRLFRDEATQRIKAELGITLSKEAVIEDDAIAYTNTLGMIGERYLEIVPGTSGNPVLQPGDILIGKDSVPMEQFIEAGYKAVSRIEEAIASIDAILGNEATKIALQETFANTREATAQLNEFLKQANDLIARVRAGEGTVGRLFVKDDLYNDMKELTTDLKKHPWKLLHRPKVKKDKKKTGKNWR